MGSFMLRWGAGVAAAALGMSLLLAQAAKAQEPVGTWREPPAHAGR